MGRDATSANPIRAGVRFRVERSGPSSPHDTSQRRPSLPRIYGPKFFEYFFDLAGHGQLNQRGMPSLLELAVSAPAFADEIRVTSPPWPVQRVMFTLLAPFARRRRMTGPGRPQAAGGMK
jgi:hypothetical protein